MVDITTHDDLSGDDKTIQIVWLLEAAVRALMFRQNITSQAFSLEEMAATMGRKEVVVAHKNSSGGLDLKIMPEDDARDVADYGSGGFRCQ